MRNGKKNQGTNMGTFFFVLGVMAVLSLGIDVRRLEAETNPWDSRFASVCFEKWISDAMSRLNRHNGDSGFNARKPWGINKYGVLEGNPKFGPTSVSAPDDFPQCQYNRYCWMYRHYITSYDFYPGWRDRNWNEAGVPRLRDSVAACIREMEGSIRPTTTQPHTPIPQQGNACGFILGSGIYNKWIAVGGEKGFLGCPVINETAAGRSPQGTTGAFAEFRGGDGGYVIWHGVGKFAGRSFEVHGCIFKLYKQAGGTVSWLGFPVSDEYDSPGGRRSDFEGGYIFWEARTGGCRAYQYGDSTGVKKAFCDQYSRAAIQKNEENTRRLCGFSGPRWQANYDNHFSWCMNNDKGAADSENRLRDEELSKCVKRPPAGPGYVGCYKDELNRDMPDYTFEGDMTVEKCVSACRDKGLLYGGVQYGNQCFCGNSYGRYGPAPNCDMKCSANPAQICGGNWANSVYGTGIRGGETQYRDCSECASQRCPECQGVIELLCVVMDGQPRSVACRQCIEKNCRQR